MTLTGSIIKGKVQRQQLESNVSTNGRVEPELNYEIHSPVSTIVKAVYVQPGDQVAAGKLLLVLDDVWERAHAEAFNVIGPRCRLLLTTRDAGLVTALAADRLDFNELWIGEMATYDAFALGAVIAERTQRIPLTLGPFAVAVRDPVMIAMGVASVAELTGRRVNVAIGSSSPMVAEQWHGRVQRRPALALREMASALRVLLAGEKLNFEGEVLRSQGYRLRATPPHSELTIAAFGAGADTFLRALCADLQAPRAAFQANEDRRAPAVAGPAGNHALPILTAEDKCTLLHSRHHADASGLFKNIHRDAVVLGRHHLVQNHLGGVDARLQTLPRRTGDGGGCKHETETEQCKCFLHISVLSTPRLWAARIVESLQLSRPSGMKLDLESDL